MLTSLNWQKMTIICHGHHLLVHTKFINSAECMRPPATWCSQTFITVSVCEMPEPWLICFFACNREMRPFSIFFCYSLWGGGGCRVRALNLTVPLGSGQMISGTGRVRASVLSPLQTSNQFHRSRTLCLNASCLRPLQLKTRRTLTKSMFLQPVNCSSDCEHRFIKENISSNEDLLEYCFKVLLIENRVCSLIFT